MIFLLNVLIIALIYGFIIFLLMLWNKEEL
jgi:hypothetical protein